MHDIVIRGGMVVDGSGGEPFTGDLAIDGDRIVAVGRVYSEGREEIDAAGCIVTPGFVDIHTHYDGQAIWSDRLTPSSSHGVTTAVLGNCGVGFAPCRPEDHDLLVRVMEGVEDIPGIVMTEGLPWTWETFPEYLDALEARPRDIDVAAFLPHNPLRVYVMGQRGANLEAATDDDLARMRALTREAIDAGAIGVATSRSILHRTKAGEQIPSFDAADVELHAIAAGMEDAGSGIVQMVLNVPHSGWEAEMEHLIDVSRTSGRPATFTLGTSNRGPRAWEQALARLEAVNDAGGRMRAQILPRPVGLMMGFELSTNPFSTCPTFKAIEELPFGEKIARLRDPQIRATLIAEPAQPGHALTYAARNWDWMFPFGDPPNYEPPAKDSVAARADRAGITPEAFVYDYMLENDGRAMLFNALGNYHEGRLDAVHAMMNHRDTVIGLGDGGAHYGSICDASYPTFLLTYWVRDRDGLKLSLPQAVRDLSRVPAETVGLDDRGLLRPGWKADVNVIDLAQLTLHAPHVLYDLPGGGRRLDQEATGYRAILVSGQPIVRDDAATEMRPGRVVRGAQPGMTSAELL